MHAADTETRTGVIDEFINISRADLRAELFTLLKNLLYDFSVVRGARIQDIRRERRRHDRFSGISLRSQRNVPWQVGAEVKVGLQHV